MGFTPDREVAGGDLDDGSILPTSLLPENVRSIRVLERLGMCFFTPFKRF
jgi:hypothetical protein